LRAVMSGIFPPTRKTTTRAAGQSYPTAQFNQANKKGRGFERTHGLERTLAFSVYQTPGTLRQGKTTAPPTKARTRTPTIERVMQTALFI
jgi:hypothetical protein